MAHKQAYIKIPEEKEKELFKYITEVCHCKILVPIAGNSDTAVFKDGLHCDSSVYVIVDENITLNYKAGFYEDQSVGFNYISYEKTGADDGMLTVKLYTEYKLINKRSSLAEVLDAIKNWTLNTENRSCVLMKSK